MKNSMSFSREVFIQHSNIWKKKKNLWENFVRDMKGRSATYIMGVFWANSLCLVWNFIGALKLL